MVDLKKKFEITGTSEKEGTLRVKCGACDLKKPDQQNSFKMSSRMNTQATNALCSYLIVKMEI